MRYGTTIMGLDGCSASLSVPVDLSESGWTSVVVANVGGRSVDVTAAAYPYDAVAASRAGVTLDEEFTLRDGHKIKIGSGPYRDQQTGEQSLVRLAVWLGENFVARVFQYDGTSEDLVRLMSMLGLVERAGGVILKEQPQALTIDRSMSHAPTILVPVQRLGLLEVRGLSIVLARTLPSFPGAPVRGGELFREAGEKYEHMTFMLVSPTAITRLYPNYTQVNQSEGAAFMADLEANWTPAPSGVSVSAS